MQIAVLCAAGSWYLADLRRAAAARHEIIPLAFRDLHAELGPTGPGFFAGGMDLAPCQAVLVRTMPPGSLEQVVVRMDMLAQMQAAGKLVLNPPKAVEAAVDKYLASAKLQAAALPTPHTVVCQTADAAFQAFHSLGGDVVVKPLFGGEGRGIARIQDEAIADRTFRMLAGLGAVLYVQRFIPHDGHDLRVLVIGERMWGMRRRNLLDWRTNVSRGAQAEPVELDEASRELARRAAAAIGAPVAGVDILPATDGQRFVIEVNAVPGWQALSRVHNVDIAGQVLDYVEQAANAGP